MSAGSRNPTIDGLRGFSALLVLLYHLYNMSVGAGFCRPIANHYVATSLPKLAMFAVMLFFCISGYLIVQSLVKHADVPTFLKDRVIRIYPLFLALHLVMFTAGPLAGYGWMGSLKHSIAGYVASFTSNLLFLPGMLDLPLAQKNAWSLSYEAAFYLIASLFYLSWSLRRVRKLTAAALATVALSGSAAAIWFHPDSAFFLVGVVAFGMATIGLRWMDGPWQAANGIVFLLLSLTFFRTFAPLSMLFGLALFLTVIHEVGWFSAFLRTRVLQYLGKISYSLYLIHPFVLDLLRSVVRRFATTDGPHWMLAFVAVGIPLSIVVAAFSFRYLETGGGRFLRRVWGSEPAGRSSGRIASPSRRSISPRSPAGSLEPATCSSATFASLPKRWPSRSHHFDRFPSGRRGASL